MGKINFGRVLLGGLAAGLILNIGEYLLNDKVLATQMAEMFRRCGFPKPGTNFIVIAVVITFVLGIVLVAGYAAIRPRFGAGPKTAIIAGLFAWFGVVVYNNVIVVGLGMEPTNVFALVLVWELVEYLLAAMVGAWLYREA
jgi:hypothetical protein